MSEQSLPPTDPVSPPVWAFVEAFGDDETIIYHGFDDCLIGVAEQFSNGPVLVYDRDLVIASLMRDGLSEDEAWEHFSFNVIGGYVGPRTPIFLTHRFDPAEWQTPAAGAPTSSD